MSAQRPIDDLESRTRFEPAEVEPRLITAWLESGLFHPEPRGEAAENYSIAIPPPNITGALHMGHAFGGTIQDVLIRHARLRGQRTRWIFGTDHAGIATQTQVERQLVREGTTREAVGREAFVERTWRWREEYGSTIVEQYKRLGASCDYDDERFTFDEAYAAAVTRVFVALHERGFIHRDHYLVNWDPGSRSAISDLEVEEREETDTLFSIAYAIEGSAEEVVVATVRPETMLGDVAVAVHPDDERYTHLIGQHAILPLVGRRIPIIADDYVKRDFGTGALKITPGHDPNDFEIGRRHGLPVLSVIGEDGAMNEAAGPRFAGLGVAAAAEAVVGALEDEGLLRGREPYTHAVPFSHRSGQRIEPLISLQWFMRMDELARPAIDVVKRGEVQFHPERWSRVYLDWMENIRPWCVSRQLWWGHRLPVYYCDACEETYVSATAPERCGACDGPVRQDDDVLDTWFSSALWPFATLGWPEQTAAIKAFYPTDALVTAREIIFLWVARMIMMGLEFTGSIPFHDVYITSVIQAPDGRRMSKSLGTGIDPLDDIATYGADGVRFGLLTMSSSQDVRYSVEKIKQGRDLANKLFNASRFVLRSIDASAPPEPPDRDRGSLDPLAPGASRGGAGRADRRLRLRARRLRPLRLRLRRALRLVHRVRQAAARRQRPRRAQLDAALRAARDAADRASADPVRHRGGLELRPRGRRGAARRPPSPSADGLPPGRRRRGGDWPRDRSDPGRARLARCDGRAAGARIGARLEADGYAEVVDLLAAQARLDLRGDATGAEPLASVAIPGGVVAILDGVDAQAQAERVGRRRTQLQAEIDRLLAKLANAGSSPRRRLMLSIANARS